ncbi:BTAD domain-containing putative transcriptional regulator [Nocardioides sp. C4-1]|uniref:BTAD domain-containing putative transcriptional regulator n=1 Tax=Nocardioides sp. C4-1 TaxID=3151851 RepID=UPI003263FDD9
MADTQVGARPARLGPIHAGVSGPVVRTDDDRIVLPAPRPPRRRVEPVVGLPRAGGVPRPRLTTSLDRLRTARITTVVAPAGAGKTTALAHWAAQSAVDVAWFRASAEHDDPVAALLEGLGAAVHRADPHLPAAVDLESIVGVLGRRTSALVVVVDDFHHLSRPRHRAAAVGDCVERLLLATDDRLRLVVASRTPTPLNLARTELASAVLGPGDLRFRAGETAHLFREGYGLALAEPDARLLTRRTGGWAAGLHLFRHAVAGLAPELRHRAVRALGRRDDYAREYLAQTVLAGLGAGDLELLRRTSSLELLTPPVCDRLLGTVDSQDRLDDLRRRGVLVADAAGLGYRTPEVLRSHLVAAMRSESGDAVTDAWFRTTAALLADEHDAAAAAVRAAVAGRDWDLALRLLHDRWDDVVADADLDWVDDVPRSRCSAEVRVVRAVRTLRDGSLEAAAHLAGVDLDGAAGRSARELEHVARTWTAGDQQPGDGWSDYLRAAFRRPVPGRRTPLRPLYADVLRGFELAIAGSFAAARPLLAGCAERLDDDPLTRCAVDLLAAALTAPDPERVDAIAARAEDLGVAWFARLAHGLGAMHRGASPGGDAVAAADDRGDSWGALLLAGLDAVGRLHRGVASPRAFDDVVRRCRDLDAPALEAWARALGALGASSEHLPEAARDADSAIGFAYSALVPGAIAVGYAASALGGATAMRQQADDEATRIGLDVRPWEWLDTPTDEIRSPTAHVVERVPPLDVRCFGGFEVRVDGATPQLTRVRPRARALLRLLALHAGQPVHREVIVEAMWPQLDGQAATHNLHVCVSGIRSALEPGVARGASRLVVRDGERYLLALPDGAVSDLRRFDALTGAAEQARTDGRTDQAIADLDTALRLYVGDVLPEDGPSEWALPHREHYKVRAAEAAALLGRLHLDHGRPAEAASAARRSIDVDPLRDASWRLLVAAHRAAGDLAASEEARRSYAEVLTSLGVATSAASTVR